MDATETATLAERLLTVSRENPPWDATEVAGELESHFEGGADFSRAVPILLGGLWDIEVKAQLATLSVLVRAAPPSELAAKVREIITAVDSKDRQKRRLAAEILLAWVEHTGHDGDRPRRTPQAVYEALAKAFSHKDPVLRKRVAYNSSFHLWEAEDFQGVLKVLVAAYDEMDERTKECADRALQCAALRGRRIELAIPKLDQRLKSGLRGYAAVAVLADRVFANDSTALDLFQDCEVAAYVCQEIGQRMRQPIPPLALEVLRRGLQHDEVPVRVYASEGIGRHAALGSNVLPALEELGALLTDTGRFAIAKIVVGQAAARALARAATVACCAERANQILDAAIGGRDKRGRRYVEEARLMARKPIDD